VPAPQNFTTMRKFHSFRINFKLTREEVIDLLCDAFGTYDPEEFTAGNTREIIRGQYISGGGQIGLQGNSHMKPEAEAIYKKFVEGRR